MTKMFKHCQMPELDKRNIAPMVIDPGADDYTRNLLSCADDIMKNDMAEIPYGDDEFANEKKVLTKVCLISFLTFVIECCGIKDKVLITVMKLAYITSLSFTQIEDDMDIGQTMVGMLFNEAVDNCPMTPVSKEYWSLMLSSPVDVLQPVVMSIYMSLSKYYDASEYNIYKKKDDPSEYKLQATGKTVLQTMMEPDTAIMFQDIIDQFAQNGSKTTTEDNTCNVSDTDEWLTFTPKTQERDMTQQPQDNSEKTNNKGNNNAE